MLARYSFACLARASLAPEPSGAQAQIATLENLRQETEAALDEYARSLEPEEAQPFRALRTEVEAYWKVLDRTFSWTPEERSKNRYAFFYEELVPRRTSMLQIADRIAALNDQAFQHGNGKVSALFAGLQFGLIAMIAVTLLGGAVLAGLAIFHISAWKSKCGSALRRACRRRLARTFREVSARSGG